MIFKPILNSKQHKGKMFNVQTDKLFDQFFFFKYTPTLNLITPIYSRKVGTLACLPRCSITFSLTTLSMFGNWWHDLIYNLIFPTVWFLCDIFCFIMWQAFSMWDRSGLQTGQSCSQWTRGLVSVHFRWAPPGKSCFWMSLIYL